MEIRGGVGHLGSDFLTAFFHQIACFLTTKRPEDSVGVQFVLSKVPLVEPGRLAIDHGHMTFVKCKTGMVTSLPWSNN